LLDFNYISCAIVAAQQESIARRRIFDKSVGSSCLVGIATEVLRLRLTQRLLEERDESEKKKFWNIFRSIFVRISVWT
jgi:hypothetical protein